MRRYDDPVETRMGRVQGMEGPEQFLWRGRLWKVRAVLAHWVETGPWWTSPAVRAVVGSDDAPAGTETAGTETAGTETAGTETAGPGADLLGERELWRVEAGRGLGAVGEAAGEGGGVFDLSFDWSSGDWQLIGCVD